jgi:hypothetical protein
MVSQFITLDMLIIEGGFTDCKLTRLFRRSSNYISIDYNKHKTS